MTEYEKLGKGFIVVWASIDPTAGRAGMRAFVVEAGTPGVKVTKLEHKLGIRVSDTATISLVDARVPYDNILGSPTVEKTTTGFKGAMATFDATRPLVAASGFGVARAALEFLKEKLAENGVQIRYGLPRQKLTSIERDVIDMEIMLKSAWLMVLKAVWMADNKKPNALESSMSKVKAGDVVHEDHAEGRRDLGTARLQPRVPAREMVPRREDHRHLRRHGTDQPPRGGAADFGIFGSGVEVSDIGSRYSDRVSNIELEYRLPSEGEIHEISHPQSCCHRLWHNGRGDGGASCERGRARHVAGYCPKGRA